MRIIIHVGPPKSGTSAIQKWLVTHHKLLLDNGIYYPTHEFDKNGVSSGNVLSLYDRSENKKLTFSEDKFRQLCAHCKTLDCDSLLLSSEFFFQRISELNKYFPTATFIAYLRFPIDVAESSYNQGVKRHKETRSFGLPPVPRSYQLEILDKKISTLTNERFILRPYHKQCFAYNNLVGDFLTAIEFDVTAPIIELLPTDYVNTSYTIESLEFKRWMNQLPLDSLAHKLDRFLQGYKVGTLDYSLVPEKKFMTYKKAFIKKLKMFCEQYNVEDSERFIQFCEDTKQKKSMKQEISDVQFVGIFKAFYNANPDISIELFERFHKRYADINVERYPHRLGLIQKSFGFRAQTQYVIYCIKRKLKALLKTSRK
jgi:hypothetical protein